MANTNLEGRLAKSRVQVVKRFVYYYPEGFLVVKVADYTGEMIKDPKQLEFHIKAPGADFRSIPVMGIRNEFLAAGWGMGLAALCRGRAPNLSGFGFPGPWGTGGRDRGSSRGFPL